ncbi:MAG: CcdB family protein [Pseudomonadota bacterium]
MKRFEVRQAKGAGVAGGRRLVVVLQHEHFDDLATAVVAPLYKPRELAEITGLRPAISLEGKRYLVAIDRLAAVPKGQLGQVVGNAEAQSFELLRGLDLLLSGF